MQADTNFPKVRRMLPCFSPLIFNTLLASFHAAPRAPCSCHSVSSWDRSSKFGALGLRWWGSPGHMYPSERFWSRILVWRAMAFVNFTRWIGFCMSELIRKIDVNFGGSMSWKDATQLSVYSMNCTQQVRGLARVCHGKQRVAPFYHATHTSSTWLLHSCHHSFWTFY